MKKKTMIVAATLLLAACGNKKEQQHETLRVQTQEVCTTTTTQDSQEYVGSVQSEQSTTVSFNTSGTLIRVCVSEGQHVKKGQLIAEVDHTQAEQMLMASQAAAKQADDAQKRMQQLYDTHAISEMDWVNVTSKVEQAHAQLQMAQKNLADCRLYAPVSGVVGSGVLSVGEVILPAMPVANILSIGRVKVKVSVPEKEMADIQPHTPTTIAVDALGGETYVGGLIEKGIEADALTHTYSVLINVENGDSKLLPGMVCRVRMQTTEAEAEVMRVPIRCVQQSADGKHFVWTAKNGKAHRQDVELGAVCGNDITVTSGLTPGERVITAGYQKVSEGSEVTTDF